MGTSDHKRDSLCTIEEIVMKFQNLGLKTKIIATATIPVLLAVILSTIAVISLRELLTLVDRSNRSYKVINMAMKTQDSAHDMRSALEGFLLSRKEAALAPYKDARKKWSKTFRSPKNGIHDAGPENGGLRGAGVYGSWEKETVETVNSFETSSQR